MSEKVLREAINIDPTLHLSWYVLFSSAILYCTICDSCFFLLQMNVKCLVFEATTPIVSFTTISRIM